MSNIEGIDPGIARLRDKAPGSVVEYRLVMECLADWANPRAKLTRLLKQGALIRIRKGLYVFGPKHRHQLISLPSLANKIFGPSYVSLEWALAHYGLIPEGVVSVTSVTAKQRREYQTPLGLFVYEHIHPSAYPLEITLIEQQPDNPALIATPEKALTDTLMIRFGKVQSIKQMETLLLDDLRIDEEGLGELDISAVQRIADARPHSAVLFLIKFLERFQS